MDTFKIQVDATDEELDTMRKQLRVWSSDELLRDFRVLSSMVEDRDYSEEEKQKHRIAWMTIMLEAEELTRRGYKLHWVPKNSKLQKPEL